VGAACLAAPGAIGMPPAAEFGAGAASQTTAFVPARQKLGAGGAKDGAAAGGAGPSTASPEPKKAPKKAPKPRADVSAGTARRIARVLAGIAR
jgi:hypothetical protein